MFALVIFTTELIGYNFGMGLLVCCKLWTRYL